MDIDFLNDKKVVSMWFFIQDSKIQSLDSFKVIYFERN
jgi:hypothetical protein